MKKLKLTQIDPAEIEVLQHELEQYSKIEELGLNHWGTNDFLNALLTVDIALRLWFTLRGRIESSKEFFNLSLKVSEAVIVLKCCTWQRHGRNEYEKNVAEKYKGLLAEQLMNII
ncbi:hypothetical protein AMR72_16420 [Flavobacterium psychrophilum]|nr:hypothetical protein AMR72_16420 [Flavobacterium psychrophilum]AOE53949.1 hypothetical protein ALW18_16410 [Flavobacterium psychrophilum]